MRRVDSKGSLNQLFEFQWVMVKVVQVQDQIQWVRTQVGTKDDQLTTRQVAEEVVVIVTRPLALEVDIHLDLTIDIRPDQIDIHPPNHPAQIDIQPDIHPTDTQ